MTTASEFKFTASYTRTDARRSLELYRKDLAKWKRVLRRETRTNGCMLECAKERIAYHESKIELLEHRIATARYA